MNKNCWRVTLLFTGMFVSAGGSDDATVDGIQPDDSTNDSFALTNEQKR